MINYSKDFMPFKGKELTENEIDNLLQEALEISKECQPSEFSDFLSGLRTGNIRIEVTEYVIEIWQLIAYHYKEAQNG